MADHLSPELQSNRDLYLAIQDLVTEHKSYERSLEEYLRALLQEANQFRDRETLSLNEFFTLIRQSFTAQTSQFEANWRNQREQSSQNLSGFERWQATLIRQIVDLHEMQESGILANEYRYFGVNSPRGSRWYNFDPLTYLECAIAGSFGGWEPDDSSDRQFVSGQVAVLAADGMIQSVDPKDLDRPQVEILAVTWDDFIDFIGCGQWYE